ncbi:MAG: endonuclease MutS2 [Candidatus Gastranaerophilales bacterium]
MNIQEKSIISLEFNKIVGELSKLAKFSQSKEFCLDLKPFEGVDEINEQLDFTKEAKYILDLPAELPVGFVADIKKLKKGMSANYLSELELIDVAKTMNSSRIVKNFLVSNLEPTAKLRELGSRLVAEREVEERILNTFDENLNIRQDATAELKGLYSALRDNEKNLKSKVSELLNSPSFSKHLQENIYTTRDDRIVFQVMASAKSKINGIVHDVSATNKTFYIEPQQIVPLNNKIREIKSNIHAECIKILVDLSSLVKQHINEIALSERILTEIDFHFAKARYAVKIGAIEPDIVSEKVVEFENMKHPLLIGNVENVVTNNLEIGKDFKSIIITGSNTGGKTVTLKTIGLFILMAKAGLFLPCTMAKVYPFKKVLADIGDEQSILQNLSTFSSHITNIVEIINSSDEETFILLDEICAGTDPVEGAVLARVILEKFVYNKAFSIITTHFGELKALEYSNPYFKNASVEFDTTTLKPTYRLKIGVPGLSNAIAIASLLGLDKGITEQAQDFLNSKKDPSILVVEKLQETQTKLAQNLEHAEALKEQSEFIKSEYEENLETIKKDKKKTVKQIKERFKHEILDVKAEIKDILEELRREKSEKIARRSYARVAQLENKFSGKLDEYSEKTVYGEIDWDNVKVDDKLILKEHNQSVTLLSLPDKNSSVFILMGNFKTKIKIDKLASYDARFEKKVASTTRPKSLHGFELKKVSISSTLDLRGYKVEDALDSLEVYLDKASLANLASVNVIHGHGTGALKQAVREFLSTTPYVASYRAGEDGEGGDGISIVSIR